MKTKILFSLLVALAANLYAQSQSPVQQQEPQRAVAQSGKGQSQDIQDISKYRVDRDIKNLRYDMHNISGSDWDGFLKGEKVFVDDKNKIIYQPGPTKEEIGDNIDREFKRYTERARQIEIINTSFSERMSKYGPQRPNKPINELTDEEKLDYYKKRDEYLENDSIIYVGTVRKSLQKLRELGFTKDADSIREELNRRIKSNKAWMDRFPRKK